MAKQDGEIKALALVIEAVRGLSEEAFNRIFIYAGERIKSDLEAGESSAPAKAQKRRYVRRARHSDSPPAPSEFAAKLENMLVKSGANIIDVTPRTLVAIGDSVHDLDIPESLRRNK